MSNDLTTQAHFLDARADARAEAHLNTIQSLENKGFFPREGGGILWVISGIALASCGGGGGGGSSSGGGGGRTPVTRPGPNPIPDPTPTPDPNPNNSPIILRDTNRNEVGSYTASVDEDAFVGASVVTIDASVDGAAQGSTITYAFVGGATANRDGFWQIGADSGTIINAFDPSGSVLDFETAEQHTLTVRVTYDADGAGTTGEVHTRDVQVVIDVNDVEGIRFKNADGDVVDSYTASVDEDAFVGASVVTIDASVDGAAQGSTITYAFVGGATANRDGFWQIGADSGTIINAFDPSGTVLDFETAEQHTLTVRVTYDADGAGTTGEVHTRDVQVVINVNDVPGASPAITPDRQSFAHQDSYDPDDLGLTPMPDADPSAG